MNTEIQDRIDLLSEGELSVHERAELFRQLDLEPSGWKRCAMALLETRALQLTVRELHPEAEPIRHGCQLSRHESGHGEQSPNSSAGDFESRPVDNISRANRSDKSEREKSDWNCPRSTRIKNGSDTRGTRVRSLVTAALVAVLLLAAGMFIGRPWQSGPTTFGEQHPVETSGERHLQSEPESGGHPVAVRLAAGDPDLLLQFTNVSRAIAVPDGKLIAFLSTVDNGETNVYPIIESRELESYLTKVSAPTLETPLIRQLEREGWRVDSGRQFISIEQADGKRQTIPFGMLNYRFVGVETF